jgi:hypothetical protein
MFLHDYLRFLSWTDGCSPQTGMQLAVCGIRFGPNATTVAVRRQTFTQVHGLLKLCRWHCCSMRQTSGAAETDGVDHHNAVPYREIADFLLRLRACNAGETAKLALGVPGAHRYPDFAS